MKKKFLLFLTGIMFCIFLINLAFGTTTNVAPNEDVEHSVEEFPLSTGALFYTEIDEDPATPNTADYIYWEGGGTGWMIFGFETPDLLGGTATNIKIRVYANALGDYTRDVIVSIAPDGTTWSATQTFGVVVGGFENPSWYEKDFAVDTNNLSSLRVKIDSQDSGPGKYVESYTIYAVVTYSLTDSCSYVSGNWEIDCADNCIINTDYNLERNNITFTGEGSFYVNSSIINFDYAVLSNNCEIILGTGKEFG